MNCLNKLPVEEMSCALESTDSNEVTTACSQESTHPEVHKNQEMVVSFTRLAPEQMYTDGNELVASSSQISKMLDEIGSASENSQLVIVVTLPTITIQQSPVTQAVVPSCVSSPPSTTTTTICEDHQNFPLLAYNQEDCEPTENCTFSSEATSTDSFSELVITWHSSNPHS